MNQPLTISNVYFIGIGGIGMSALARYFLSNGVMVSGYDKSTSSNIEQLQKEGAIIHFDENVDQLDKNAELVVYTPAIPVAHKELEWYRAHDYNIKKRSEVLSEITDNGFNICIAGTHGKTTISIMIAHILRDSGYGCNAFLGGISVNYGTNFWSSENNVNVIEADEYDRSFLRLDPAVSLISAMDADHLDVYGDIEKMREAFFDFAGKTKDGGLLVTKFGLKLPSEGSYRHIRYSLQNESADVYAKNIVLSDGGYVFDVCGNDWQIEKVHLHMGGMHNVENAVAAIAIAQYLKISAEKIMDAVDSFKGVKRRFEYIIDPKEAKQSERNVVYIDDYAHHPEELKALLQGARSLFNNRRITVIFQPHLFSRTRDFYRAFAQTLSIANMVILLPVYPARELPIEGVSSEMIADKIESAKAMVMQKNEVLNWVLDDYIKSLGKNMDGDVLITAGAGDIDQLVKPIKEILFKK